MPTTTATTRYLDALDPAGLGIRWHRPVVGPDYLVWAGEAVEELETLRQAQIVRSFGTFAAAEKAGALDAYITAADTVPGVQGLLNERFGDPHFWRGYGAFEAGRMHRADPTRLKREQDAFQLAFAAANPGYFAQQVAA